MPDPLNIYAQWQALAYGYAGSLAYYHPHWTRATSPLLDELGAVLDRSVALKNGGSGNDENLVTSCDKCNGRKSSSVLGSWIQREVRKPIHGKYGEHQNWDGLSRLFPALAERHSQLLPVGESRWVKAIKIAYGADTHSSAS